MKPLIYQLIIPLTIISFVTITKSWYVLPVDGVDTVMHGFPLPYTCEGWHTSMSSQYFAFEFFVDITTYFTFWLVVIFVIHQFIIPIKIHKTIGIILMVISLLIGYLMVLILQFPEDIHHLKRDFDMQILDSRWEFIFGENPPYIYDNYHREEE